MFMEEFYTCPACGVVCDLHHRSPAWEDSSEWASFWHGLSVDYADPERKTGKHLKSGRRKGICEQLDETGQRAMMHFALEIIHDGRIYISHRKWSKRTEAIQAGKALPGHRAAAKGFGRATQLDDGGDG
jgi:hypothetical protein